MTQDHLEEPTPEKPKEFKIGQTEQHPITPEALALLERLNDANVTVGGLTSLVKEMVTAEDQCIVIKNAAPHLFRKETPKADDDFGSDNYIEFMNRRAKRLLQNAKDDNVVVLSQYTDGTCAPYMDAARALDASRPRQIVVQEGSASQADAVHSALLESLGVWHRKKPGVWLVEVDKEGNANAYQLTFANKKMGFFKRVAVFFSLIFKGV